MATLAERQATYGKRTPTDEERAEVERLFSGKTFINLKRPSPASQMNSLKKKAAENSESNESETED